TLRKRDRVQHCGALVAQDGERPADGARRLVLAVAARRVEVDAGAGNEGDRTLHRSHDLAERNLVRRPRELVPALWSASALHQTSLFEVEHDQLKIFRRYPLRFSDAAQLHWCALLRLGKEEQGP